jgi:hypothetical protein
VRQTHTSVIKLQPGDRVVVVHTITLINDTPETVGFAGLKWEPIWTTETDTETAAILEHAAAAEIA